MFSITAWYGKLRHKDKNKLGKIIKKGRKLGANTRTLDILYQECAMKQVEKIMQDASHPLHQNYVFLRSGSRLSAYTAHWKI